MLYIANDGIQLILRLINEIIISKPCKQPVYTFGSMILNYCIQPIDGDTYIVNQANPFLLDLSYRSESYLYIVLTDTS